MITEKIINYSNLITKSTKDFIGRQWVRDAVGDFLKTDRPHHFLLLGEPGSGKTTFMADLVRRQGYPHHFIGKGSQISLTASLDWRNPIRFAESIGYQLIRDYGGWIMNWDDWGINVSQEVKDLNGLLIGAEAKQFQATPRPADKPKLTIEQEVKQFGPAARMIGVFINNYNVDIEQAIQQLLTTPLRTIAERCPERQIVLVVDGLNEAEDCSEPQHNILKLLPHDSLPTNVRFLFSSRPGEHLTSDFLSRVQPFWLSEDEQGQLNSHTIEDAQSYVIRLTEEEAIGKMLALRNIEPEAFSEQVASASLGNFLYLHHYAQGLRKGDDTLLNLTALPKGLNGIYQDFLGKIKKGRDKDVSWDNASKPVLGTLAVAQNPLTQNQIANFSGVKRRTVATILMQVKPFLDVISTENNKYYTVYHTSFGEYLISEENEDYIDAEEIHSQISAHYLNIYCKDWQQCDVYGLKYLAHHLAGAEQFKELFKLVAESNAWAEARNDTEGGYAGYLRDLERAWEWAESESVWNIGRQIRCALIQSSIYSQAGNIAPELLHRLVISEARSPSWALEHITQITEEGQKAESLSYIFPLLPEELKSAAVREVLDLNNLDLRIKCLSEVVPYLPDTLKFSVLQEVHDIDDERTRAWGLHELVFHLPVEFEPKILEIVAEIKNERALAIALEAIPWLAAGITDEEEDVYTYSIGEDVYTAEAALKELRETRKIFDKWSQVFVLSKLALYLPEKLKNEIVSNALTIAEQIEDPYYRFQSIAELVQHLQVGQIVSKALTIAEQIEDPYYRFQSIAELVQHTPVGQRELILNSALEAARNIPASATQRRVGALSWLAYQSSGSSQSSILEEAITAAEADDELLSFTIPKVVENLPDKLNNRSLREVWSVVKTISITSIRRRTLIELSTHMPDHIKTEVLSELFRETREIKDAGERADVLIQLANHLESQLKVQALSEAIVDIHRIDRSRYDAALRELVDLLRSLPNQSKLEIVDKVLEIEKRGVAVKILSDLIDYLPDNQKDETIDKTVNLARRITDPYIRIQALYLAKSFLPPQLESEVFFEALETARQLGKVNKEKQALSLYIAMMADLPPNLPHEIKIEVAQEALDTALEETDNRFRTVLLSKLSEDLPDDLQETALREAFAAWQRIDDEWTRAELVGRLPKHLHDRCLPEVRKMITPWERSYALWAQAEQSNDESRSELLLEAIDTAQEITDQKKLHFVLLNLLKYIPDELKPQWLLTAKGLEWSAAYEDGRSNLFAELVSNWKATDFAGLGNGHGVWPSLLHHLARHRRSELLIDLAALALLIEHLGGNESIRESAFAIRKVTSWWP